MLDINTIQEPVDLREFIHVGQKADCLVITDAKAPRVTGTIEYVTKHIVGVRFKHFMESYNQGDIITGTCRILKD